MFIVQACRGPAEPAGAPPQAGFDHAPEDAPSDASPVIPDGGDFLVVYSTTAGHKAYRDPGKGSWFISLLLETLEANHEEHDLEAMIREVRDRMTTVLPFKQIPSSCSTLRKAVYLPSLCASDASDEAMGDYDYEGDDEDEDDDEDGDDDGSSVVITIMATMMVIAMVMAMAMAMAMVMVMALLMLIMILIVGRAFITVIFMVPP